MSVFGQACCWKVAAAALLAIGLAAATPPPGGLLSRRTTLDVRAILAPDAPEWKKAPAFQVDLGPQLIAPPVNATPSVKAIGVRSLHDEHGWIAFRLEWRDGTRDDTPRTGEWADVAAIEFPLDPKSPPAPMMGSQRAGRGAVAKQAPGQPAPEQSEGRRGLEESARPASARAERGTDHAPGGRVQIIQWRADWQKDVDRGETTIRDLYPNAVVDAPLEKVYRYSDVQAYSAARAIGNIVSQARHFLSVQDLMAEGFGSLTPKPTQNALGKGVWKDGIWKVVIARPMEPVTDPQAAPLVRDTTTQIAFAVWNGSAGERGARKGWAGWFPLRIE